MLTVAELESSFRVYFDELTRCQNSKCYWALLHLLVIIPDICSAMETTSGDGDRDQYVFWCERYFGKGELSGKDFWDLRCTLVHQGRTFRKDRFHFSFSQPRPDGSDEHNVIFRIDNRETRTLDVDRMCQWITTAMRKWFQDLQEGIGNPENVRKHLPHLAKTKEPVVPNIADMGYITKHITSSQ